MKSIIWIVKRTLLKNIKHIENDPTILNFLEKMPAPVAASFSEEQLSHILTVIASRGWGKHNIDYRGTFKLPLYQWRFYYVILLGKNYRELSRKEKQLSIFTLSIISLIFLLFSTIVGLLILYLIKSALGINILNNYSFGIWDWFRN